MREKRKLKQKGKNKNKNNKKRGNPEEPPLPCTAMCVSGLQAGSVEGTGQRHRHGDNVPWLCGCAPPPLPPSCPRPRRGSMGLGLTGSATLFGVPGSEQPPPSCYGTLPPDSLGSTGAQEAGV